MAPRHADTALPPLAPPPPAAVPSTPPCCCLPPHADPVHMCSTTATTCAGHQVPSVQASTWQLHVGWGWAACWRTALRAGLTPSLLLPQRCQQQWLPGPCRQQTAIHAQPPHAVSPHSSQAGPPRWRRWARARLSASWTAPPAATRCTPRVSNALCCCCCPVAASVAAAAVAGS